MDKNYQLQLSATRYYDGLHCGYDNGEFSKMRNFKTFENAKKAAKKELKGNERPHIARYDKDNDHSRMYDENGRELSWENDKPEFWHVDGVRIVDRETQRVLWECEA